MDTIRKVYNEGIWLEITTLIIPDYNDSEEELRDIAKFISSIDPNIPWHISRFYPTHKMYNSIPTPIEKLDLAKKIGFEEGLNFIYLGNILEKDNTTYCPICGEILLKRKLHGVYNNQENLNLCRNCGYKLNGVFK